MFAMICTDNLRYKKTKYYDSEYVIKGTLHINEHAYAFSHYDGAFEVLGIRWLSNYTKGRYSKDTGLEFSFGADTEEGRLLQEHKDEAIECILQTVHAYKLTNIDAWVEYFNFAVSCTGTYQLLPDVKFIEGVPSSEQIKGAEMVWLQTNYMSHKAFYKIIDIVRSKNIPLRYFTSASAAKGAEQVVAADSGK